MIRVELPYHLRNLAKITGPGHIWLQSMTPQKLASAIEPYLPEKTTTTTTE